MKKIQCILASFDLGGFDADAKNAIISLRPIYVFLLAPSGALIVTVVYYRSAASF